MSWLAELQRRRVFRVGAAYVVVAWLAIQAVSIFFPAFDAPPWLLRVFILLCLIGFPVTLVMAWVFDITPEGVQLDATRKGSKRMFAVAGLLALLAVGWYFYGQPTFRKGEPTVPATAVPPDAVPSAASAPPTAPVKSIAVLAFTDLSPEHDQEYFSDGMSEEILNALAKIQGLKVAGRTSSFYFKGRNEDLRSIGRALGVAHVLEGSVRKQGDKVRITAQLIRSEDGFHLWSESYDGDLADVFSLQEKIAREIAGQLQLVLSGDQAMRLVNAGTRDPQAYALYLQATATFNRRDGARFDEALAQLRQAVALDPTFARAYSRMATLEAVRGNYAGGDYRASVRDAERFARQAIALDPRLAEPHAALALVLTGERHQRLARAEMDKALALDPNDMTTTFWNGVSLIMLGYRRQGVAALEHTLELDPLLPNALVWRARIHIADGELDIAERQLQRAAEAGHSFVGIGNYWLYRARGDAPAARAALAEGFGYFAQDFPPGVAESFAGSCVGEPKARTDAMRLIDDYLAGRPPVLAAIVPYVLICSGQAARAFDLSRAAPTNNESMMLSEVFSGLRPEVFRSPEFATYARDIGLATYWDEFGAPDACRRVGKQSYACE